uniref:Putative secreted peptide n=1 Tax=Anopheles braziliensis TaxID=58242 RepID=A0A2M3ZVF2_9DIPT
MYLFFAFAYFWPFAACLQGVRSRRNCYFNAVIKLMQHYTKMANISSQSQTYNKVPYTMVIGKQTACCIWMFVEPERKDFSDCLNVRLPHPSPTIDR